MFRDNKIIIVDNEQKELDTLASVIWREGIACKALKYDDFYETPLKGVRVAFFDVNLTSSIAPSAETYDYRSDSVIRDIFDKLAVALQLYIAIDNGPYALIFWTSNQCLINNFKAFIDERSEDYSIPSPIYIDSIDKSEFLTQESLEGNALYDTVFNLIKESPVHLLYDLEKKANQAITNAINDVHSITQDDDYSWVEPNNNLKQTFIEIAKSTVGKKHVKEHFGEGIIAALNPMINFHMEQLITSHERTSNLFQVSDTELNSGSFNNIEKKYELNTIFHLNKFATACERGAVYECSANLISKYIGNKKVPQGWMRNLINFKEQLSGDEKSKVSTIIDNSKIVALELSPACDYSQKKDRLLKFILGIKTVKIEDGLLGVKPGYSFFPKILFKDKGEIFQLIFNFNYTISIPRSETNDPIGELLFSLKKDYMDMLTTQYANHISRIGVTEFK